MPKHRTLNLVDIVILTFIFFGIAIYSSTIYYLSPMPLSNVVDSTGMVFNESGNWSSIIFEIVLLAVAWCYLKCRHFDFTSLNFTIHRYTILKAVVYILIAGSVATGCEYLYFLLFDHYSSQAVSYTGDVAEMNMQSHFSISLILFSLLNGFYEELFFLGLIFLVHKRYLTYVLIASLFIRFAFHTYQGIASALVISTLGIVFIILRLKDDELPAFMLAHSFFDIFGLGLPLYLLDYSTN